MSGHANGGGARRPGQEPLRPLPKRFYKAVTVAPTSPQEGGDQVAFGLRLDGKPVRTPARNELRLPTRALAEAVAAEWEAQG
jgi:chaperone required for assembly of F1-ATPase